MLLGFIKEDSALMFFLGFHLRRQRFNVFWDFINEYNALMRFGILLTNITLKSVLGFH